MLGRVRCLLLLLLFALLDLLINVLFALVSCLLVQLQAIEIGDPLLAFWAGEVMLEQVRLYAFVAEARAAAGRLDCVAKQARAQRASQGAVAAGHLVDVILCQHFVLAALLLPRCAVEEKVMSKNFKVG